MSHAQNIQIPVAGGYATTGRSFDEELSPVLWRRARLVFLIGLAASSAVFALNRLYGLVPIDTAVSSWRTVAHLLHPISFAAGLLAMQVVSRDLGRVQAIAALTVLFNVALVIPNVAVFYPMRDAFLPVGLLLFVHAAFIPGRKAQIWLAGVAIAVSLVSYWVLPPLVPGLGAYWESVGARIALWERVWQVAGTTMLGVISVLVSRNLYSLQRSAHRAKRLGNYLIEKQLGEGGMGKVYVAQHAMICRPTAVKVMSADGADGPTALARFEREVRLSASLTHPNTITIFDFGRSSDNTFYYAMEYLEGLDLDRMVKDHGPLTPERVVYLLRQVCGSLSEAHARGIVHRDIKPSNIFVTNRGGLFDFVKVLDFGLARKVATADDSGLTKTGMVFGTPRYIAPETVSGAQLADARSDLYNVGGVAYWVLTGQPLFPGASSLELIIDHVKTVPSRPKDVSKQAIPEALDAIVMKLLEKDPNDRFQTAAELIAALQAVPLAQPWSQERAREWWSRHAPQVIRAADSVADGPAMNVAPARAGSTAEV